MTSNISPSSGNMEVFNRVIPDLGSPTVLSTNYVYDVDCYLVNRAGAIDYQRLALNGNTQPHLRGEVIEGLGKAVATLGWIELKARIEVVVRSSDAAIELGQHDWFAKEYGDVEEETVLLHRFGLGEQMFAIDYDHATGQSQLKSRSEVIAEGKLTPYMDNWLTRIAAPYRMIGFDTLPYRDKINPFVEWIKMDRKL